MSSPINKQQGTLGRSNGSGGIYSQKHVVVDVSVIQYWFTGSQPPLKKWFLLDDDKLTVTFYMVGTQ